MLLHVLRCYQSKDRLCCKYRVRVRVFEGVCRDIDHKMYEKEKEVRTTQMRARDAVYITVEPPTETEPEC